MMISKEFKAAREFATMASQLHEQQHYEAATTVVKRIEGMLGELEESLSTQVADLKKELAATQKALAETEAKLPKVLDGAPLVINCTTTAEGSTEAANTDAAPAPEAPPQAAP
jgi:uncharacterized protein YdgA (DUF945 family)